MSDTPFSKIIYGGVTFVVKDPTAYAHATDANKISAAVASGFYKFAATAEGHIAGTAAVAAADIIALIGADGKISSNYLPSYVDDVIEGYYYNSKFYSDSSHTTEITGETGKIYVDLSTNKTYRWGGTAYAEISESLALGTTSSTAYRGDYGNTAYGHATDASRLTTAKNAGLYKFGVTAEGHVASATAVEKSDITALGIPGSDTTYTASDGVKIESGVIKHTNAVTAGSVTPSISQGLLSLKYANFDAQGHITGVGSAVDVYVNESKASTLVAVASAGTTPSLTITPKAGATDTLEITFSAGAMPTFSTADRLTGAALVEH